MDEKIFLLVRPELESTGIWKLQNSRKNSIRENVSYESLNLPDDLIEAYIAWQELYNNCSFLDVDAFDWKSFNEQGLELAKRLKVCLFYEAIIEYSDTQGTQKIYGYMVMADFCSSLWTDEDSSCILEDVEDDLSDFKIVDRELLQKQFETWITDFNDCLTNSLDWESFNAKGNQLVEELQKHLPDYCVVFYNNAYEEFHPMWWEKKD